jgi:UPF0755 protein
MKRKKKKNSVLPTLLFLCLLLVLAFGVAFFWWQNNTEAANPDSITLLPFTVEAGMTATDVGTKLADLGVIRNATVFRYYCKKEGVDASLKVGVYELSPAMELTDIIAVLLRGPTPDIVVVNFPEGFTTEQVVARLVESGLGSESDFYTAMTGFDFSSYDFISELPEVEYPWEGYLFPATYYFDVNATPTATLRRFLDRFAEELTSNVLAELNEHGMSIQEWVIKASIVERETMAGSERPTVAGVFENRLAIGMKLQSCATVQYILGVAKPVLSYDDIAIPSPYNTYLHEGLPPGPVCNPGHASLEAALYPEDTDFMYFVAKGDGYSAFAVTYEEHLNNVAKYQ